MSASWSVLLGEVAEVANEWRSNRPERQARRGLDRADFERLAQAGFLRVAVPEDMGGLWRTVGASTRPICEVLRTLAAADPSVALVASMHPAVLGFWLARPDEARPRWTQQRTAVVRHRGRRRAMGDDHVGAGQRWRHPSHQGAAQPDGDGAMARCRARRTASPATSTSAAVRA